MSLKRPIHDLAIPITMKTSRKCLAAVIPIKWASFNIFAAVAEKHAVSLSPANPVSVFPVQKDILTDGQILSAGGFCQV